MEPQAPKDQFPLADLSSPSQLTDEEARAQSTIPAIRTFSSDLAEAIKDQQGSVVKIAIAQDEKNRREVKENSPKSAKNMSFIVGGLIVLVVAVGAVGGVLWYKNKQAAAVQPVAVQTVNSIIRTEQVGTLDITNKTREDIIAAVGGVGTDAGSNIGTIKNILLTETDGTTVTRVPAADFLAALGSRAPADFSRALEKDFMLGIYHNNRDALFLILRGTAHDYVESGMLKWEPYMVADLGPLLHVNATDQNAAVLSAPFTDAIEKNQSVRMVAATDGTPALLYTFLDPNTVLIATDPALLVEAVRRSGK